MQLETKQFVRCVYFVATPYRTCLIIAQRALGHEEIARNFAVMYDKA